MDGHLLSADGSEHEVTNEAVRQLLGSSTKFWLDLMDPEPATADALLRDTFGFHELAVEDAEKFGQRPKLDSYDDYSLLVVFGADHLGQLIEVHCFYSEQYLVTVHRGHCPDLAQLADRLRRNPPRRPDHIMLLYRVVDALIDGYFPVLGALDDRIDELEDAILQRPTEEQLGHLFDLKRTLIAMRKVVTPQRDLFATFLAREDPLPGMTPEAERYFRDLYDHLIRISDLVDSYRDLLSGALDTHLSTVSNRLNAVMKQLTIIATIFLPLSFLTGFFGQNFGWMVGKLTSLPVFLAVGVGLQLGAAVGLLVLFRRRGWLASDATAPASLPRTPRAQRTRLFRQSPATVPTDLARD
ncbi:MAG TPA: magnesium/cobalt transporter CorA [Acidimicrobiales bacterium]|nr:magnesium/cobalt transporter CorA [Acidimicrobiales bacterium]